MKYIFLFFLGFVSISFSDEIVCRNFKMQTVKKMEKNDFWGACPILGDKTSMGDGYFQTYIQLDPLALGYVFPEETLNNLPTKNKLHDGLHCFDINGDGDIVNSECAGGHQRFLFFPREETGTPITWALLNWNPAGHIPPGVYDHPHFDFHFYIQSFYERNAIEMGPCDGHTNCEVYAKAIKDVPEKFMPKGHINVKAVEAKMGNHLIDPSSGEFDPQNPHHFTHTFIWGSYDGHITFLEPMITLDFLKEKKSGCFPIKMPSSVEIAGLYPTKYCIRFKQKYYISLEGFQRKNSD